MSTTPSPAMKALAETGGELAEIEDRRREVIARLRAAIRVADREGGNSRSQITATARVARQTVYDAIREPIDAEQLAEEQATLERLTAAAGQP